MDKHSFVNVKWTDHRDVLMESIWKVFSSQSLLDFELVCDSNVIRAHSLIMFALCEIIPSNLVSPTDSSNFAASNLSHVNMKLNGVNEDLCKYFLEFLYRGKADIPKEQLQPFLTLLRQARVRGLQHLDIYEPEFQITQPTLSNCEEETIHDLISERQNSPETCDIPLETSNKETISNAKNTVESEVWTLLNDIISNQLEDTDDQNNSDIENVARIQEELEVTLDDELTRMSETSVEEIVPKCTSVHHCTCKFELKEDGDKFTCKVNDALKHCKCQLHTQQSFAITFPDIQNDSVNSDNENEADLQLECCENKTNIDMQVNYKDPNEVTTWHLESYVERMMDLSRPLDEDVTNDDVILESQTAAENESSDNVEISRLNADIYKKCCNIFKLQQNDMIADVSLKQFVSDINLLLGESEAAVLQDSNLLKQTLTLVESSLKSLVCVICQCRIPNLTAYGFHMVRTHLSVNQRSTNRVVNLNCHYCRFVAHNDACKAFHLTENHADAVLRDDSNLSGLTANTNRVVIKEEPVDDDTNTTSCQSKEKKPKKPARKAPVKKRKVNLTSPKRKKKKVVDEEPEPNTPVIRSSPRKNSPEKNGKSYTCDKCGYITPSAFAMMCHNVEHLDQARLQCQTCNEAFKNKSGVLMHMLKHAKPADFFQCEHCTFQTPWNGSLNNHLLAVHNIKVKVECHICNRAFNSPSALTQHREYTHLRKRKTEEVVKKRFQCPKCRFLANSSKQLYAHVYERHIANK